MDNLQNLSSEIDNIKNRIKDSEYKTIMELLGKIHNKEKTKMVRVLEVSALVYAYVEWDDGDSKVSRMSDFGFKHKKTEQCDECGECVECSNIIHIEVSKPEYDFREYNLRVEPRELQRPSIDVDKGYVEVPLYDELKSMKHVVFDDKAYLFLSESEE